ncbi:MAG: hypothetical protein JNJ58_05045 [Chitinophagaceae bacterium]|nr:hypothetical protein [Chitinophagaceae bacterium]
MRFLFSFCICLMAFTSPAQRYWSFELHGGWAGNIPLPLRIQQDGHPDIYFKRARFSSEPFVMPVYWDWRFSKRINRHSFEFEAIHHKLYLLNPHPDIQRFGISHGFNILTLNYARYFKYFIVRNGIGSVLMHPESTIRNLEYPEGPGFDIKGYRLRGIVWNTAVAHRFHFFRKRMFLNLEAKATFAKANAPIVNGVAKVNNIALQMIGGLGVNFLRTKK